MDTILNILNRLFRKTTMEPDSICCSESEFREKLKIERSRTHRNTHEFSLVTFDIKTLHFTNSQTEELIEKISSRIRNIDTIGWYDKDKIGVILPYTAAKGANSFAKNIIEAIREYEIESQYALITYPPEKKDGAENSDKPALRSV